MTDAQIIRGIKDNDSIVWRYICRNLKPPFVATLNRFCFNLVMLSDDWDDIFQESCMILMENIKQGKFVSRSESSLFNYFIEIGKRTMQTALRKKAKHQPVPAKREDTPHIIQLWPASAPNVVEEECEPISAEDSQKEQDRFLDRVFDMIPDSCKTLLKKFYWEHKPMDEISSILSLRNADTAKTKKNRCMNQFKDIARRLVENDEFAEEMVRACVERAVLRELLEDERVLMCDESSKICACAIVEDMENPEDEFEL
jgi:RNA polymerase sigma factor (sigma-70 family)